MNAQCYRKLINTVNRVAAHNNNGFTVKAEIRPTGRIYIECFESAENHSLNNGLGDTLEEACENFMFNFPGALASWGYTMPELN